MLEIGEAYQGNPLTSPRSVPSDFYFYFYFVFWFEYDCRKRRLAVNPNLKMIYPTFGLTVETLHELKIQSTGSF